jgi:TfoX/Sxy family transcriptional regulator of competence genes
MATTLDFIEYVHEQSKLKDSLSYKKMFGEYALYLNGKVVALVCDNSLYVKPTAATQHLTVSFRAQPPYPGAKPYLVADELLDDGDRLRELLLATAEALPAPKVKVASQKK